MDEYWLHGTGEIRRDPMNTCKSCGAEIQWVTMGSGKKMPLDMKKKTIIVEMGGFEAMSGFESHFVTCPQANKHRKS